MLVSPVTPQRVHAQAVSVGPEYQAIVDQIIAILMQQVAELQRQLTDLIENESSSTREEIRRVRDRVDSKDEEESKDAGVVEEEEGVTISVSDSICIGDKIVLPFEIDGEYVSAWGRIKSKNGVTDMKQVFNSDGRFDWAYGNTKDLSEETSSYGNIADNPYINGQSFSYEIKAYDSSYGSQTKGTLAEVSGTTRAPDCN